jgi:hypothetical protein
VKTSSRRTGSVIALCTVSILNLAVSVEPQKDIIRKVIAEQRLRCPRCRPYLSLATEVDMTDQVCGLETEKAVQDLLKTAEACLLKLMPGGPLGTTLFWFLVLCVLAVPFVFRYYIGLVGQG